MANDIVRVVLMPKDADADTAGDRQIILDLKIDSDTNTSTGPFPAFGRVGDFRKPDTLYSFTLMGDGRMDYGAYASDAQRQDKLEIRTAPLSVGGEVSYKVGDASHAYTVASLTPLLP